ncbi:DUF3180 domain-containing protein [Saccharothrix coeruleofusca]|uniref:Membrane protein n=1 Tax=Saccharothrix coeruleofusca TaxID=33919 RepID=A0A918AJ62_9PSEU|nr:DUF3180 domain-containing protein [Saccharothrix coeruleofusca]MBP2340364.1 hypothetical protein [Saccharothrix coeruleofusca]GGP35834.1 membrane protein [Saccharothrix coeruleofusca]
MRFTRTRDLLAAALIAGLLAHLVLRLAYDALPLLPRFAGFTLLVISAVDVGLAFSLRARILRKPGARPVQPLTAARAVALAKASSLLGAIMLGGWAGVLVYVLPARGEFEAASNDLVSSIVGVVCAAALIGAGLWLEHCCRTPPDPHADR